LSEDLPKSTSKTTNEFYLSIGQQIEHYRRR